MRAVRGLLFPHPFLMTLAIVLLGQEFVRADLWGDPKPPMCWEELLACDRIIEAKYHSHKDRILALKVIRVFKGKSIKPGDVLQVALEHLYSIETSPTWGEKFGDRRVEDSIPRLCYKQQIMNPGEPVPLKVIPDVSEAAVYFIHSAGSPGLIRSGQVQHGMLAEGWRQAVQGERMDMLFRLAQNVNPRLRRDALEELYLSRDRAVIEQLFR